MRLFQAPLNTCLNSPFFVTLSVHGLHFTVYAPSDTFGGEHLLDDTELSSAESEELLHDEQLATATREIYVGSKSREEVAAEVPLLDLLIDK